MIGVAANPQNQFGIFAGAQTSTAKYTINDTNQPHDYKYGFNAGAGWKIPFDNHLYFSPCAFYSLKGYKVRFNQFIYPPDTLATYNNTTIHTFNLAFLLQFDLGDRPSHFFLRLGPSLDFQLSGKEKFYLKNGGEVQRKMPYGFADYGHYSASLLMQLGFETRKGLMIFGQYDLGLGNLSNTDGGPTIKHRVFGLSVGTYFNKKRIVMDTRNKE
jgi:hypothetical protein